MGTCRPEGSKMDSHDKNQPSISSYLKFIFISPITSWWALFTGIVEIAAFIWLGNSITLNRITALVILFFGSLCLLGGLLVILKGWEIFSKAFERISITQIVRIDKEQFFLLKCPRNYQTGMMFEVFRKMETVEVPIGFIETVHFRDDGIIQAKPIWIRPVHLGDIERGQLAVESLVVYPYFSSSSLPQWIDEQAEKKVIELIKRGTQQ